MNLALRRWGLGAIGLVIGVAAVLAVRDATLSTHQPVVPGSQVELLVAARSEGAEPGQTLPELVEALLLTCRLEVPADLASPIRNDGRGQFRVTLAPALDQTDRRQLRGCIEDWTIDQLMVNVVSFTDQGAAAPAPNR
jgi:hypothetical protein